MATTSGSDPLAGLNPRQQLAAGHGDGPLLVIAGAGTGKTRTLAARVGVLLRRGVPPERILLLTFTRRAAHEMLRRAACHADPAEARRVWGGTFHAVAHRLLRINTQALGLPPDFTVLDAADSADVMNVVTRDCIPAEQRRRFPRKETIAAIYTRVAATRTGLGEVLADSFPWCRDHAAALAAIFDAYSARKREQHLLDFDDLLLFWHAAVSAPGIGERIASSFDHVLVDEYQDTNVVQSDILRAMRATNPNITAVGDDAQAIYSFRAATVANILDFPRHFPGSTVVTLELNYRSAAPILAVSNAVAAAAQQRYPKTLRPARDGGTEPVLVTCEDEAVQADAVCDAILAHHDAGVPLAQQAVLFRAGHHSAVLEIELARRNVPFVKYGGLRFVEAAHVKDLLAVLRLLDNPYDEAAWFRVLQLFEGIGPARAHRLLAELGVRPRGAGTTPHARLAVLDAPAGSAETLRPFAAALGACTQTELAVGVQIETIADALAPVFEQRYDSARARVEDLHSLARLAGDADSRSQFATEIALDPPSVTGDLAGPPRLDEDWLTLSTVHSAKGCEWEAVHVIHAADGMFPSDMATGSPEGVEEERRLFYVAVTRPRRSLHVYFPLRYHHQRRSRRPEHNYAQVTRFIPSGIHHLFEHVRAGTPEPVPVLATPVDAALGALWRA
ncbi:MAG: ATP-dependent helicase [Acidimicrobiia bacterium]